MTLDCPCNSRSDPSPTQSQTCAARCGSTCPCRAPDKGQCKECLQTIQHRRSASRSLTGSVPLLRLCLGQRRSHKVPFCCMIAAALGPCTFCNCQLHHINVPLFQSFFLFDHCHQAIKSSSHQVIVVLWDIALTFWDGKVDVARKVLDEDEDGDKVDGVSHLSEDLLQVSPLGSRTEGQSERANTRNQEDSRARDDERREKRTTLRTTFLTINARSCLNQSILTYGLGDADRGMKCGVAQRDRRKVCQAGPPLRRAVWEEGGKFGASSGKNGDEESMSFFLQHKRDNTNATTHNTTHNAPCLVLPWPWSGVMSVAAFFRQTAALLVKKFHEVVSVLLLLSTLFRALTTPPPPPLPHREGTRGSSSAVLSFP